MASEDNANTPIAFNGVVMIFPYLADTMSLNASKLDIYSFTATVRNSALIELLLNKALNICMIYDPCIGF
jgi:hypothetical protein